MFRRFGEVRSRSDGSVSPAHSDSLFIFSSHPSLSFCCTPKFPAGDTQIAQAFPQVRVGLKAPSFHVACIARAPLQVGLSLDHGFVGRNLLLCIDTTRPLSNAPLFSFRLLPWTSCTPLYSFPFYLRLFTIKPYRTSTTLVAGRRAFALVFLNLPSSRLAHRILVSIALDLRIQIP